jgi:AmmeMemoRadiSam system protein A
METPLKSTEKAVLLDIARQAVVSYVRKGNLHVEPREEKALNLRRGCFVTLTRNGQLRGCIGNFQSEWPLFREVAEMAVASATKDPRFYPMLEEDLDDFSVEISVLSPLQKIEDPEEIKVGTHGIYLEKGYHRGVLLPQVAPEHNWDRTTFLQQTCIKAGLPSDAWRSEDVEIYVFAAEVFNDRQVAEGRLGTGLAGR